MVQLRVYPEQGDTHLNLGDAITEASIPRSSTSTVACDIRDASVTFPPSVTSSSHCDSSGTQSPVTIPTTANASESESLSEDESEYDYEQDPIHWQGELVSFRHRYLDLLGAPTIREAGVKWHIQIVSAAGKLREYSKIVTDLTRRRREGERLLDAIHRYKRKTINIAHLQFSRAIPLEREINAMVCMLGELEVLLESSFELYMQSWRDKLLNWQI
jgi:hypothetical protein